MTEQYESIRVETRDRVTTVVLDRPERRNAVDGPMAAELAHAFKAFDHAPDADVAVLWGNGGHFCAGADLKAVGTPRQNTVAVSGDGPMGPTRLRLSKPVIAAVEGYAVAGGLELHRSSAPTHRHQPGHGHDPHRPPRRRSGSRRVRTGQPGRRSRNRARGSRNPRPPTHRFPADVPTQRQKVGV